MESVKRSIAVTAFSLARYLDVYFYHLVISCALLIVYNVFIRKDWDKILFKAASDGNIGLMAGALQHSADVNFHAAGECTPLIIACVNNREESVRFLLEAAAGACKLDLFDEHGRTALHAATQVGNEVIIRLLLDHGADVRAFDNDGSTPLITAATAGRVGALQLLLGDGRADIQWKNKNGLNALIVAIHQHSSPIAATATSDRLSVISQLLDAKIDVEACGRNGWTAIISASYRGHTDVVELLVRHGAKVNAQGRGGISALMAAAQNGWKDTVQLLLNSGAKSDLQSSNGSTALIAASAKGYDEVVRLLGQHDASLVHRRFGAGSTALMAAVTKGFIGVVRELLSQGCDVDTANEDNWTALLLAAQRGFLGITKQLLQKRAVVDCYTSSIGFTPLMYAIRNAYKDIVVELLDHGAMVNHFELDASNKEVVTQKMPLVYGYITPLMLAVISGDRAVIELLLHRQADLHLDLFHLMIHCCKHPSTRSSSNGSDASSSSRELLLEKTMKDATFVYSHCGTALLLAIHQGDPSLVELLLQHEADMKRRVVGLGRASLSTGLSPLSIVRYEEQWILDDRNSLGAGVLQLAAERGDPILFLLLLRRGAHFDRCSVPYWCILGRFYCSSLVYRCRLVLLARIFLALLLRCVRAPLRGVEQSVGRKVKLD